MLVVFAGGMVASALLGEPILGPLKNSPQLLVATACWYVVFYTPFDIGYKVSKFLPVKLVASAMKEIYRAKKVRRVGTFMWTRLFDAKHYFRFMTELSTQLNFTPTLTSS
jgi:TRIC channel